ncbi:MAG: antibiotic biosynthesis monooxygenase [Acidobacteria bacterium]|nr:antibiotic biosynthesis monooxygenase [Acidobacteriota bacterium]
MIVLTARYYVMPGKVDDVLAALKRMAPLVAAHEPDCEVYHVSRADDDQNLLLLYEEYRDEAAFTGHRETKHFKEIIEGLVVPMLERRERELFRRVIP